jgi:predicted exporter
MAFFSSSKNKTALLRLQYAARVAAALWLLAVAIVLGHALTKSGAVLVSDMRALVPESAQSESANALLGISDKASRAVYVLAAHPEKTEMRKIASSIRSATENSALKPLNLTNASPASLAASLAPWSENFLTASDAKWLQEASDRAILNRALRRLARPGTGLLPFSADPLGLFENWLNTHPEFSRFTLDGDQIAVADGGKLWNIFAFENTAGSASDIAENNVTKTIGRIRAEVGAIPGAQLLAGGVSLIAEQTKVRAQEEASLIGLISLIAILAIAWGFFRGVTVMFVMLGTLTTATAAGFAAVVGVYGSIHLLTFVFGATLSGICADYVLHWFTFRKRGATAEQSFTYLFRPLSVSFASTLLAFCLMAFMPVPSVRQMALFCCAGLATSFLIVFGLLPLVPMRSRAAKPIAGALRAVRPLGPKGAVVLALAAVVLSAAAFALHGTQKELGLLINADKALLAEQARIARLVSPVTPGQFIVLKAEGEKELLERQAALTARLEELRQKGSLSAFRSLSSWIPAVSEQESAYKRVHAANERAARILSEHLSEMIEHRDSRGFAPLTPSVLPKRLQETVLAREIARSESGTTFAVTSFSDLTPKALAELARTAASIPGASLTNLTGDISDELTRCKETIQMLLVLILAVLAGYFGILYRRGWWRLWLPCALTVACTQALLALCGIPWSLFSVLPLVLLTGLSVDYAVLAENDPDNPWVWDSLLLAGSTTIASFGLLAFSSTPALSAFGMTIALGIVLAWGLTLMLRKD